MRFRSSFTVLIKNCITTCPRRSINHRESSASLLWFRWVIFISLWHISAQAIFVDMHLSWGIHPSCRPPIYKNIILRNSFCKRNVEKGKKKTDVQGGRNRMIYFEATNGNSHRVILLHTCIHTSWIWFFLFISFWNRKGKCF